MDRTHGALGAMAITCRIGGSEKLDLSLRPALAWIGVCLFLVLRFAAQYLCLRNCHEMLYGIRKTLEFG